MTSPLPTAAPEDVGLSAEALTRLSLALQDRISRGQFPGAVALVARHGKVAFHQAFGARDPATEAPMQTDAIFRIYSMTKPIVSVATMMLWEEGRFLLTDPIGDFLPELAGRQVGVERNGALTLVPAERPITVQDLLRHTSGLTYEGRGNTLVHRAWSAAGTDQRQSNAGLVSTLGKVPLLYQPGTHWEYSRSTDVLGRLVEVVSGQTLGAFLHDRILGRLGMADTAFFAPGPKHGRIAEPFSRDPETGSENRLIDATRQPEFESGGGGLVGTAMDYARFCQMLLNGGRLDDVRLLGRKTVELMASDHLGDMPRNEEMVPPGHGFGLGFAVKTAVGLTPFAGSVGTYYWSGVAGTGFWIDPAERLFAVLMVQAPGAKRGYYRTLFRNLVYAAVTD